MNLYIYMHNFLDGDFNQERVLTYQEMSFLKTCKVKSIVMSSLWSFIKTSNVFWKDELKDEVYCADSIFRFGNRKWHLILIFRSNNLNIRCFHFWMNKFLEEQRNDSCASYVWVNICVFILYQFIFFSLHFISFMPCSSAS